MELSTMEKLELGVLEKVCQIFFDQMGFTAKPAGPPTTPGVSGLTMLYSKSSDTAFSLCQCAVRTSRIDLNLLGQLRDSVVRFNLPSGYFITTGSPESSLREFAKANKINLIDGLKFTELINNLPETSRNLLNETITAANTLKQFNETGRFQLQANETGRYSPVSDITPPICAKCGERMKLQVSTGKYKTGKYWQCPNPECGHITALV